MEIYILRHAIAVPRGTEEYPNDDRPLTETGIQKMKVAAKGIAEVIRDVDLILTSPLARAHDTAKIAAKALRYKHKIELCKELLPGTSLNSVLEYLDRKSTRLNSSHIQKSRMPSSA